MVVVFTWVIIVTEFIARRLIVGEVRVKVRETEGKNIQIWGFIILSIIFVILLMSLAILDVKDDVMKLFWLCLVTIALGFQAFLEWKFLKGYKEYMVTLTTLTIAVIFILLLF